MYCPECGTLIEDDVIFCPECGTKVVDDAVDELTSPEAVPESVSASTPRPSIQALMLTHMAALADKLGATEDVVRAVLDDFIAARSAQGIAYTLIDANNCDTGYGRRSLRKGASWTEWADLLRDVRQAADEGKMPNAECLFIIGGNDIVPMPVIRHYLADDGQSTETTIDTDVPYTYPFGAGETQRDLSTGELYDREICYTVGRLPLPADARLDDLTDYLMRAGVQPYIKVRHAYAQCDPHWRRVTNSNVAELKKRNMLRVNAGDVSDKMFYSGIYLTPEVDTDSVSNYLAPETQLAFFNLHGSAAPNSPGFMGQSVTDPSDWRTAIMPSDLQRLTRPNVIVTEACYGARFEGFDTRHSMVQAALAAQTLIYLGSSRIAYGSVDSWYESDEDVKGTLADVLTSEFVHALLSGYTAGDALWMARYTLLDNCEMGPYEATTLAEFNLYGDPTMQVAIAAHGKAASLTDPMPRPLRQPKPRRRSLIRWTGSVRAEKFKTAGLNTSVLRMVRGAVDNQLTQIHEKVAKELYDRWGIRPRQLTGAVNLHYATGKNAVALHYETDDERALSKAKEAGLLTRISVIVSPPAEGSRILAVYAPR